MPVSWGRTGIDELELELKSGDARALFTLASKLAAQGGLRLRPVQGAAGYRLAGLGCHRPCSPCKGIEGKDQKASITLGLQHWHHEQLWLESGDAGEQQRALHALLEGISLVAEAAHADGATSRLADLQAQQRLDDAGGRDRITVRPSSTMPTWWACSCPSRPGCIWGVNPRWCRGKKVSPGSPFYGSCT